MKKQRWICLLLALLLVFTAFTGCNDNDWSRYEADDEDDDEDDKKDWLEDLPDDLPDHGGLPVGEDPSKGNLDWDLDGSWSDVNFGEQTLKVEVSAALDAQVTFPAADIYTKGPDAATTDEIQKKVLARNARVEPELGIKVEYSTSYLSYSKVLEHVQKYVQGAAEDAPDVLDNDIYGLTRAMVNGYLWNVKNPGKDASGADVYSYFDFNHKGWYTEYMNGASFHADKQYILAGDYHIDLIRYAWVFFVNVDLFDQAYADTDYGTYEELCSYITEADEFFYEDLIALARIGWNDTSSPKGETDLRDARIGVCFNNLCSRIFLAGSGLPMVQWTGGAEGKGTPSVVLPTSEAANNLATLSELYTTLFNSEGVHYIDDVLKSTTEFFNGNIILTMSELGEMESQQMRGTQFVRGILPFPQYNRSTPGFRTIVHDMAEVSCILNNASSFTMASAYMQFINEESAEVLTEYYEKGLKFKYNESKTTREMIDFVKDHIGSPFESVLGTYVCANSTVASALYNTFDSAAQNNNNSFASTYAKNQGAYQASLEEILAKMDKLD